VAIVTDMAVVQLATGVLGESTLRITVDHGLRGKLMFRGNGTTTAGFQTPLISSGWLKAGANVDRMRQCAKTVIVGLADGRSILLADVSKLYCKCHEQRYYKSPEQDESFNFHAHARFVLC
jgi:hypothetical protein